MGIAGVLGVRMQICPRRVSVCDCVVPVQLVECP